MKKNFEIIHYYSRNTLIFSKKNIVHVTARDIKFEIQLPINIFHIFSFSRLLRRLFRLDKCNVF